MVRCGFDSRLSHTIFSSEKNLGTCIEVPLLECFNFMQRAIIILIGPNAVQKGGEGKFFYLYEVYILYIVRVCSEVFNRLEPRKINRLLGVYGWGINHKST